MNEPNPIAVVEAVRSIAQARDDESTSDALIRMSLERVAEWGTEIERRDAEIERLTILIQEMRRAAFTARSAANDAIWKVEEIAKEEEVRRARDEAAARPDGGGPFGEPGAGGESVRHGALKSECVSDHLLPGVEGLRVETETAPETTGRHRHDYRDGDVCSGCDILRGAR